MSVEGEKERDEEVMSILEGLKRLLPYPDVRGSEHQEHTEQHDMTGYTSRLGVVYLYGRLWPDLITFNIEKATRVSLTGTVRQEVVLLT